jgi:hypothetical protein
MDDGASPAALRGAALQAVASLQAVIEQARSELERVTRMIDATATPESLVSNPDNPVEMQRTLTVARTECAAAREALAPFAHAWSRKMELIAETAVDIFVDPLRPDKTRRLVLADLRRANQVYRSMTVGIELLERLHRAEGLLRKLVELNEWAVQTTFVRGTPADELLYRLANLTNESNQHLGTRPEAPPARLDDESAGEPPGEAPGEPAG